METCVFCGNSLDDGQLVSQLRRKGSDTINNLSLTRNREISTSPGQRVHQNCRRDFVNPNSAIGKSVNVLDSDISEEIGLRSSTPVFNLNENCLFCGQLAKNDDRKRGFDVSVVRTFQFQRTVERICKERGDSWSVQVSRRLQLAHSDLHAADSVYHQQCSVNFRTGKQMPLSSTPGGKRNKSCTLGRPNNLKTEEAFAQICRRIEANEDEQVTIGDMVREMEDLCGETYSTVHMKKKVKDYFGSSVVLTEVNGRPNIITFRRTVPSILHDFYERPVNNDKEEEKRSIIKTAAKLIKEDIKSMCTPTKSHYPSADDIACKTKNADFIPKTLQLFLQGLFSQADPTAKIAAIGQSIIQAARPRTIIAPLQIGLGVQIHHHFGSRFLIDILYNLGFSASYNEVQKYEANAAASRDSANYNISNSSFIQYIADNVDHNIRTLDGYGTFHGMGIVAAVTPGVVQRRSVPRGNPTIAEITDLARIDIKYYEANPSQLSAMKYEILEGLEMKDNSWKIDLLSKLCWSLRLNASWGAIMHKVMDGPYPGKSTVVFLPMIDLNSSDLTCIYSTLHFVCKEAKHNKCTPILTFDQPLYWKSMTMIQNEHTDSPLKSIVLKLGGFHAEMSFTGSRGHIMSETGLSNLLETVYASTSVSHMLSGKAIARAVRGHFLIDTALTVLVVSHLYDIPIPISTTDNDIRTGEMPSSTESDTIVVSTSFEGSDTASDILEAAHLLDSLLMGVISPTDVVNNVVVDKIAKRIDEFRDSRLECRTARLWFQYMEMVDILRKFIKAERTGDWVLHLQSLNAMLPYLAASGHNMYVKSIRVYLQQMTSLETKNPEVDAFFKSGYHVVRRSDTYWAGISADLAIEQALMRSIKTTGGMTRGRGMNESQRAQWILSMSDCVEINNATQELTDVSFQTSDQHKEDRESRKKRDTKDAIAFLSFLAERNPFIEETVLRNIETGVTASKEVNVDSAKDIGCEVLKSMDETNVTEYSFRKKNQAVTLRYKSYTNSGEENIPIDPQLLFQRFIVAANDIYDDKSSIFEYELCGHPSSMFDSSGFMRPAQKSILADAIWNLGDCSMQDTVSDDEFRYVVDGGSLLHRLQWSKGLTFGDICNNYIYFIKRRHKDIIVVFDGYSSGPDTKNEIQMRRTKGIIGTKVSFNQHTTFRSRKEIFLANAENKQSFINMLSSMMRRSGIETKNADADADVLIARTAVTSAILKPTILLGEDTDLLVLLLNFIEPKSKQVIFKSDMTSKSNTKQKIWDIKNPQACWDHEFVKFFQ